MRKPDDGDGGGKGMLKFAAPDIGTLLSCVEQQHAPLRNGTTEGIRGGLLTSEVRDPARWIKTMSQPQPPSLPGSGRYHLDARLEGAAFFDFFNFEDWSTDYTTHGSVSYAPRAVALQAGFAGVRSGLAYMAVDNSSAPTARPRSIRLRSRTVYDGGLFVIDVAHLPTGCGSWPAFWSFGPNWPVNGEIDLIEGVNVQDSVRTTLHTSPGCTMARDAVMSGTWLQRDCAAGGANLGCSVVGGEGSFGSAFNANGGGVFAMEWNPDGVRAWFWAHGAPRPADINDTANSPSPDSWGTPYASFTFGAQCSAQHFNNHSLIFDTTLCGAWAGAADVWAQSGCDVQTGHAVCADYIAHASAAQLATAHWLVRSLTIYQCVGGNCSSRPSAAPPGAPPSAAPPSSRFVHPMPPGRIVLVGGAILGLCLLCSLLVLGRSRLRFLRRAVVGEGGRDALMAQRSPPPTARP